MLTTFKWIRKNLPDTDVLALIFSLLFAVLLFALAWNLLKPVFASVVIAYLLHWLVVQLERYKIPHSIAVISVFSLFMGLVVVSLLGLLPLLWRQLTNLFNQLPMMIERGQALLTSLPVRYPDYISVAQIQSVLSEAKVGFAKVGQVALSLSLASLPGLVTLSIYLILVPLLVYFFMMDRVAISKWFTRFLPKRRKLLTQVWEEVREQIGNYVRGKVVEIIIVSIVCYIVFLLMHLPYAILLAALLGLSVIIPYIGAVLVTIPILIIACLQWGWSSHLAYFVLVYALIIAIDANILVPLLFSEVVDLHPVAIILAVLIFGSLWGFWGVFFAIPLASLVKAILNAIPGQKRVARSS
jgi:putative permease